jgi:hypothetical protein
MPLKGMIDPNTKLQPHDCPACGGWKPDADDFCVSCRNYRDEISRKKEREKREEEERRRAAYWAIHG